MRYFSSHFNIDPNADTVHHKFEQLVSEKFRSEKEGLIARSEIFEIRKNLENFVQEVRKGYSGIESRMHSQTYDLITWVIAAMLTLGALIVILVKVFFDK